MSSSCAGMLDRHCRSEKTTALVVDVITVGLDNAFETTPPDLDRVTELETMVDAYLSTVLHD